MDSKSEFTLTFEGLDGAQANAAAESLKDALSGLGESEINVSTRKERADTQDFGATLVLIFSTQFALALAKGIADWIRQRPDTKISIRDRSGKKVLDFTGRGKDLDKLKGVLHGR